MIILPEWGMGKIVIGTDLVNWLVHHQSPAEQNAVSKPENQRSVNHSQPVRAANPPRSTPFGRCSLDFAGDALSVSVLVSPAIYQ